MGLCAVLSHTSVFFFLLFPHKKKKLNSWNIYLGTNVFSRFQSHHTSRSRFGTVVERLSRLQILEDSRKRPNIYKHQLVFFSLSPIYISIFVIKLSLSSLLRTFSISCRCCFFFSCVASIYVFMHSMCAFSSTYFLSLSLIFIFKSFFNRRFLSKFLSSGI